MRLVALRASLASVVIPALVFAQTGTNKKPGTANESLSRLADCGVEDFTLFEGNPQKVMFHLVTSWIPGEKRQGMLRYKMVVFVPKPLSDDPLKATTTNEVDVAFLRRVAQCSMSLELHDKDDFVLRSHVMPFKKMVDGESAQLTSLLANDVFQMNAQEYRQFLNGGSWTISWSCVFNP
jgi:hypothetical protein